MAAKTSSSEQLFTGKSVVLTGAAGAIGSAIAHHFARNGARLVLLDRRNEPLSQLAAQLRAGGAEAEPIPVDLADPAEISAAVQRITERAGPIHVLVNAAGIVTRTTLEDCSLTEWDEVMNVNVRAAFLLSQAVGQTMLAQGGGVIVNIGSLAGRAPAPGRAAYSISKAALMSLTELIAVEWGPRGIRCNTVAPGRVETQLDSHTRTRETVEAHASTVPARRVATCDEIAEAVIFFASDKASYINGVTLPIDGGLGVNLIALADRARSG